MTPKKQTQTNKKIVTDTRAALFEAIGLLRNADEAKAFLTDLCTPAELEAMADRWQVVGPIKQGKPYRKIHAETGVSITTIGRVARFIEHGQGGYDLIYPRWQRKQHANPNPTKPKA